MSDWHARPLRKLPHPTPFSKGSEIIEEEAKRVEEPQVSEECYKTEFSRQDGMLHT